MKKLLSLLGSIALITATTTNVIACNSNTNDRFTKPAINDEIKRWVLAQIDSDNASNTVKYSFNDLFTKAELKTAAVRLINTVISKFFYGAEESSRARFTSVSLPNDSPDSKIAQQLVNFVEQVAMDNLYTSYLNSIEKSNPLEIQIAKDGYSIDYQTDNWYVAGVKSYFWTESLTNFDYTKSRSELDQENFKLDSKDLGTTYADFTKEKDANKQKKMLRVRFKDYFDHVLVPKVLDNILTATYLHQNQLRTNGQTSIYLNKNGTLFNAIQSWNTTTGSTWNTYVKMAWELKLPMDKLNALFETGGVFKDPAAFNTKFRTDKAALITDIKTAFSTADSENHEGIDPIFGVNNFKGFIGMKKTSGTPAAADIFTTNPGIDAYKDKLVDPAAVGLLKSGEGQNPSSYQFIDSNKRYGSVVIVLPIYAIDLMKNTSLNYSEKAETSHNVDLNWYAGNSPIEDLDQEWLQQQKSITWLYNQVGFLGTNDDKGNPIYNEDGSLVNTPAEGIEKAKLLKWLEYTFATRDDLQTAAKTKLYSNAFANNPDNIYSQTLYDEIGSYIQKD
ncbi:hypothetical protein SSYRP_v1c09610 [Spiroplasma syrphidicola EA-1]|uniref:Lipoprotein n=1 Tax=Spiroplasma syrphidicola EA-1 TaxID=1276229 RepID=R4U7B6_9MOLU|nr:lipoprotein [Spiroplasma syrphidicola]AGM26548.1 hypothetical protein SSYRP_v1c09610 [Spiroplasma syrphidicola EA-1]